MPHLQGFDVGFLLKLNDIKAVDGKTTLLQFCIEQAMDQSPTLAAMPATFTHLKPACRLQITAVTSIMAELHQGHKQAKAAVLAAMQVALQQPKDGADKVRTA